MPTQNTFLKLNVHDAKVIGFHVVVAMLQAALAVLGTYHYGTYDVVIAALIQAAAEAARRIVV